jgi:hypothetical protein
MCLLNEDDKRGEGCGTYKEKRNTRSVLVGKLEGRKHFEELVANGRILLKLIFQKYYLRV